MALGGKDPAQGWTHGRWSVDKQRRKMCYSTSLQLKVKRNNSHYHPTNEELPKEHHLEKAPWPHTFTFSMLTYTILKLASKSRQQLIKSITEFKIKNCLSLA